MGFAHMDPRQAVQAHHDLQSRKKIGIHYGTFQLTAEDINEPVELLAREKVNAGLEAGEFIAAEHGDPVVISPAVVD